MHSPDQSAPQSSNDDEDGEPPAAPSAQFEQQLQMRTATCVRGGSGDEEKGEHAAGVEEVEGSTSSGLGSDGLCAVDEIDSPEFFFDSFEEEEPRLLHILWIDEGKRRDTRRSNELLEQAASECAAGVCAFTVSGYFIDEGYTLALSREWDLVVVHVQGDQAASFAGRSASWQVSLSLLRSLCVQKGYAYPTVIGVYCPYYAEAAEPTVKQLKEQALIEDFCFYPDNDLDLNALLERFLISWGPPRARHASVSSDTTCATEFVWDEPCTDDVYLGPTLRPGPAVDTASSFDTSESHSTPFFTPSIAHAGPSPSLASVPLGTGDSSQYHQHTDAAVGSVQSWQPLTAQCAAGAPVCAAPGYNMQGPAPVLSNVRPSVTIRPMPSFGSLAISQRMRRQHIQRKVAPRPHQPPSGR